MHSQTLTLFKQQWHTQEINVKVLLQVTARNQCCIGQIVRRMTSIDAKVCSFFNGPSRSSETCSLTELPRLAKIRRLESCYKRSRRILIIYVQNRASRPTLILLILLNGSPCVCEAIPPPHNQHMRESASCGRARL